MPTRDAYGKTLVKLGNENDKIVVLDADLSGSTRTAWFKKEFPERFINVGVAEQNLLGISAGLALSGMIPFCSSFAMFLCGRAWEITRNSVAYPNLNVNIVASHSGITVGEDGASHQCIEDISIMRAIPNIKVFVPSDGVETSKIIEQIVDDNGPCYVRTGRSSVPVFHDDSYQFIIGKGELCQSGTDATLVSCGNMTIECKIAIKILDKKGFSIGLINMASIKPIDEELLIKEAKKSKLIITCEEHTVVGGLGSAVAEVVVNKFPVKTRFIGLYDRFGTSGTADDLMDYFKLRGKNIAEFTEKEIKNK
jgi:transketolase